jgi:hypothetical protein
MTELRIESIEMPTAEVGELNPLPPLFGSGNADKVADLTLGSAEIRANAAQGRIDSVCPYLVQDRYSRDLSPMPHPVAVLENDHVRATFLLNAGGRLWSLVDKDSGTDLLFTNPVFQPANLALRNAWFAGGVEWNVGTIGHTPGTCDPIHAVRVRGAGGEPVLRLYEFDRIRRVVYSLDAWLPPDSGVLFVAVRIVNPNDHEVPMYWWSNMAVRQTSRTRVLAPAHGAWSYSYDQVLRLVPVESPAGPDISYPAAADASDAADFFFDIPRTTQPWIAAVDEFGTGVFQTSTARLVGRKLFRWGTGAGGQRWQEWLSGSRDGYAEIQAGLASTQFEHLPMPAGAQWSWVEAYGRIDLPPEVVHGGWGSASAAAGRVVSDRVSQDLLESKHAAAQELVDVGPDEVLHSGSGWGALERHLRARTGEPSIELPGTPFPDTSLGAEQRAWMTALDTGQLPEYGPADFPVSLHLHPVWESVLDRATGWAAPALIGVIKACSGDLDGARAAWIASLGRAPSAFAWRNLAALAAHTGDLATAVSGHLRALELAPTERALVIEALRTLIDAGQPGRALELVDGCPAEIREHGRVRLLEARAAARAGELARCGVILESGLEVPDLREGEDSLAELWWEYQARLAGVAAGESPSTAPDADALARIAATVEVPAHLDFRMRTARRRAD